MSSREIGLDEIFIGRAHKYNHYQKGETSNNSHSCANCIRKEFSFPYTCYDGWPLGNENWVDRGNDCINWTNDINAVVD